MKKVLLSIIIIVVVAIIAIGGVFAYQYFSAKTQPVVQTQQNQKTNQTIQPSITVTSPNGGETLSLGQNYKISWTSSGLSDKKGNISLMEYDQNSKGLGAQWIAFSVPISQGYYNWTPNAEIPAYFSNTNKYKIIIKPDPNTETFTPGESDNYFSIVAPTTVGLTADKILNSNGFINGKKGNEVLGTASISNIVFGDLDGDGSLEAIAKITSCGASCSNSVSAFKLVENNALTVMLPESSVSGAAQNIDSLSIANGVAAVTETDAGGTRTTNYQVKLVDGKLQGKKI